MKKLFPLLAFVILCCSCNDGQIQQKQDEINALRKEFDSLVSVKTKASETKSPVKTFLTFQENNAEEAMNFYVGLFKNSKVTSVQRYGKEGPAKEGTIMFATFELNGSQFACSDSYVKHEWNFSPAVSIFIEATSEEELTHLFEKLSESSLFKIR